MAQHRDRQTYFHCENCPRGTVVLTSKSGLMPVSTASGAITGAVVGSIVPVVGTAFGAIVGGAFGGAGGRVKGVSGKCLDCGAVYPWTNVRLLREKAMPLPGTGTIHAPAANVTIEAPRAPAVSSSTPGAPQNPWMPTLSKKPQRTPLENAKQGALIVLAIFLFALVIGLVVMIIALSIVTSPKTHSAPAPHTRVARNHVSHKAAAHRVPPLAPVIGSATIDDPDNESIFPTVKRYCDAMTALGDGQTRDPSEIEAIYARYQSGLAQDGARVSILARSPNSQCSPGDTFLTDLTRVRLSNGAEGWMQTAHLREQ